MYILCISNYKLLFLIIFLARNIIDTGICTPKSCIPVLSVIVLMISTSLYCRRLAVETDFSSSDGIISVFLRHRTRLHARLFKRIKKLLREAGFPSVYISNTTSFLEKNSLDRNLRSFKLKVKRDEVSVHYWIPLLHSIGFGTRA